MISLPLIYLELRNFYKNNILQTTTFDTYIHIHTYVIYCWKGIKFSLQEKNCITIIFPRYYSSRRMTYLYFNQGFLLDNTCISVVLTTWRLSPALFLRHYFQFTVKIHFFLQMCMWLWRLTNNLNSIYIYVCTYI